MNHPIRALAVAVGLSCALPVQAAENIIPAFSAEAESSHVFCDATGASPVHKAPCTLRSVYVTTGATAGYLMTFNAVSAPGNGAVTPRECIVAPANSTVSIIFNDETQESYGTGMTALFSTTGCFTATASATAFFKGRAQ
jgi:hypothetical protein